jgi:hypothetical protein
MAAFVDENRKFVIADLLGHFEVMHFRQAIRPEHTAHTPPFGKIIASN